MFEDSDIAALVELASRAPKSQTETLWLQQFVSRFNQERARLQAEQAKAAREVTEGDQRG